MKILRVQIKSAGRADRCVAAQFPHAGRKSIAAYFADGRVRVKGRVVRKGVLLSAGTEVELIGTPSYGAQLRPRPQPELELDIVYQDAGILACNKPAGMATHPLTAAEKDSLANALVARFPECQGIGDDPREAGLLHRLDIGTSGVVLAARTPLVWQKVRASFAHAQVHKVYWALVAGAEVRDGSCDRPLLHRGKRMVVAEAGQRGSLPARTSWRVLASADGYSLLSCTASTGRMHQVRVHLAHAAQPIVGDGQYGGVKWPHPFSDSRGHFLHARSVELAHWQTDERWTIEAELPADRLGLLRNMKMIPQ